MMATVPRASNRLEVMSCPLLRKRPIRPSWSNRRRLVIGAEIEGIDLGKPLTPSQIDDIHVALLQWKVLFFRDQKITDEQQLAFGRYFGKLTPAHPIAYGLDAHPEIWERAASDYKPRHRPDLSVPTSRPPRDYKGLAHRHHLRRQSQQILHPARRRDSGLWRRHRLQQSRSRL